MAEHFIQAAAASTRTGTAAPEWVHASGAAYPVEGWAFDAATDEYVFIRVPSRGYASGAIEIQPEWYPRTATSGNVVHAASVAAVTPGDAQDIEADSLATQATVTDAATGSKRLERPSPGISVAAVDGLAAGDFLIARVGRAGTNGSDSLASDAIVTGWYVTIPE